MFGESRSIKPEEDKRPAGVLPRISPSSRQLPTRVSSSPFSSTMARTLGQLRKAPEKGSESNNPRKTLNTHSQQREGGSPQIIEEPAPGYSPSTREEDTCQRGLVSISAWTHYRRRSWSGRASVRLLPGLAQTSTISMTCSTAAG